MIVGEKTPATQQEFLKNSTVTLIDSLRYIICYSCTITAPISELSFNVYCEVGCEQIIVYIEEKNARLK